jgi:hypothetical protein
MNSRRALVVAIVVLTVLSAATLSYAVSEEAVLFLRIAPGARAAGMGEAFVAIADDATATHWNPAGLGTYPMAGTWDNASVPQAFRPLTAMAALRGSGSGERHLAFDIWAIGAQGVMRFDNKDWNTAEIFRTRTDQTVKGIVTKYLNVSDEARLTEIIGRVAEANSPMSLDTLAVFLNDVMGAVPASFRDTAALRVASDSLLALYPECRIKWELIKEARQVWLSRGKDEALSSRDMDRIFTRLDGARNRFVPEELRVPYSAIIPGQPTVLSSSGAVLFVGTTQGLVLYNGRTWRSFTDAEGLPSNHITSLASLATTALIGTAAGAVLYDGVGISKFKDTVGLPADTVVAVAAQKTGDYYAIVHNDLYHFDGLHWTNTLMYTVAVDDSPQAIASKFAIYGSAAEQQKYLDKLLAIPQAEPVKSDSAAVGDSTAMVSPFTPGNQVVVPYLAEFKGGVTDLRVISDVLWIGTEYGVLYFDKNRWHLPGYREATVVEGQTLLTYSQDPKQSGKDAEAYAVALRDINDLAGDSLTVGQTIKVRSNPASAKVNSIGTSSGLVLVATDDGLLEYGDSKWARADMRGLGSEATQTVFTTAEELWLATDNNLVTKSRSQSEVTLMHAKWLPELAPDLYYDFASLVTHIDGLGTVGGNITFISYGQFQRTGEGGIPLGTFESFDLAATVSYGTSLTNKLKGGISTKIIYSRLADQGAGTEQGSGTSTGFALDLGLLYQHSSRLNLGLAITNIGPKMAYIDAAQADPLPTNMAIGFAYKLKQTDYLKWLVTAEGNKMLPSSNGSFSKALRAVVWNGGTEIVYANIIAGRVGYIYDRDGQIKALTVGAGLSLLKRFKFDFAYIPSNGNALSLANTLRVSMAIGL